eukprot:144769-Amphidinium_carterae.1
MAAKPFGTSENFRPIDGDKYPDIEEARALVYKYSPMQFWCYTPQGLGCVKFIMQRHCPDYLQKNGQAPIPPRPILELM